MAFKLGSKVTQARALRPMASALTLEPAAGGTAETLQADYVLVAIGRRPFTQGLNLESVGLQTDKRDMLVNDHHRSAVPGIWVIGDVTSGPMLAHKAEDEAVACIEQHPRQAARDQLQP